MIRKAVVPVVLLVSSIAMGQAFTPGQTFNVTPWVNPTGVVGGCFGAQPQPYDNNLNPDPTRWRCSNGSHFYSTSEAQVTLLSVQIGQLIDINRKLDTVQDTTVKTNALLLDRVNTFTADLRKAINDRFDQLLRKWQGAIK
jgi:hypothetical protein